MILEENYTNIRLEKDGDILTVKLNRPDIHNAFNEETIAELKEVFQKIKEIEGLRAVIITGEGKSFCAGADLNWMKKMAAYSRDENVADAGEMADMFEAISRCPVPTIARVNGPAFGGGAGLVAVCDFAIAGDNATFAFSEVNLGLIPAVISKFAIERLGPTKARQLFMTGERFDASRAAELGLLDIVAHDLDGTIDEILKQLGTSGKNAVAAAKELVANYRKKGYMDYCVEAIADIRSSDEGKEGVKAFLEKRKPAWRSDLD